MKKKIFIYEIEIISWYGSFNKFVLKDLQEVKKKLFVSNYPSYVRCSEKFEGKVVLENFMPYLI